MVVPPIPTPTIPEGSGNFSVIGKGTINASALTIYNAIVDTSTYPDWCTFVPAVEYTERKSDTQAQSSTMTEGAKMMFTVCMSPGESLKTMEEAGQVPPPPQSGDPPGTKYTITWVGAQIPRWLLRAERVNEIVTTSDPGVCDYSTSETFAGPLAGIVKWKNGGQLTDRFEDWFKDLKKYCEAQKTGA